MWLLAISVWGAPRQATASEAYQQRRERISVSFRNASLAEVLQRIKQQTGYYILYNSDAVRGIGGISFSKADAPVREVLDEALRGTRLEYSIDDDTIVIRARSGGGNASAPQKAPDKVVSGRVTDTAGAPLVGVNILIQGTATGVVSGSDGGFSIRMPEGRDNLIFSHIGYVSQTLPSAQTRLVRLVQDEQEIENVVVTGIFTRKKESYTGSATTITSGQLARVSNRNVFESLKNIEPSLYIMDNTLMGSDPNTLPDMQLRGITTFPSESTGVNIKGNYQNRPNQPLFILDGFETTAEKVMDMDMTRIESITILKDAAAKALYGSKAANGVIVITTKKGKKDKIRISYKGNVGIASRAIPRYDLVDMKDYVEMSYEALRNSAQYGTGMDFEGASRYAAANLGQQIGGLKNPEYYNPYKNYTWETLIDQSTGKIRSDAKAAWNENWLDEISDNSAIRTEHIVSVNGGSERANYVASLGYYMEDGILQNTDFSRYTGRVGADSQAKSWLKIGMNANFAHSESSYQSFEDASTSNVWYTAQFMAPVYPVYLKDMAGNNVRDADGRLQYEYGSEDDNGYANRPSAQGFNSKAELYNNKAYYTRNSLSARSYITFGTVREEARLYGLKLTMNFGTDYTDYQRTLVYDKEHGNAAQQGGRLSKTNTRTLSYTFNQLLTYDRTFGDHSLNLLAGHEYYRYKYNYALGEKTGIVGGIDELGPAVTTTDNNSYSHNYGVESYLARINYGFKSRYYIDASWRTDGSSRFHPSDRWGHFWSVGASWRISEEQFMENTRQWLDNLTLKVSYGVQGNDNLGTYYAWQGLYDYTWPNATDAGAFVDKLENRKVTWEKNGNLNAGIEATMFGGRLGVSVEYYNRKTRDMLLNSPLPISTGFTGFNDNVGSLRNQGLEVSLRGTILDKRDFRWDATLMGSFNRNKVLSLTGGQDVITSDIRVIEVGRPIYTFYLPKTAGVDPATGKQLYYAYWTQTVNDEGALVNTRCDEYITDNVAMATLSKYYHESREPKLFGSIGSTFTILKNIDVSFLTTYSIGGWVYDGLYNGSMYVQYAGNNWHKNAKRRWQKPGDKTDVPMLEVGGSYATASNSLIDASYFAIKNITVGYTLPKRWLKKIDIESLRIYATLDNIAMFNHMDGMDPQYNFTGSVAYSYTPSRVIAFGIDLNF